MKMLRKLFLSHAVVQVFGGNLDPSLLFPQMSYITSIYPNTHHLFYQNGTGEHVSHISHPLPGRSSMSITRTYRRPAQSKDNIAIWYKLPSQTKSTDHMPSHTSSSYRMPSETSSISHIPSLSDGNHNIHSLTGSLKNGHQLSDSSFNAVNRSSNTPFPPKQSVNKSHFGTYMITYTPSDQSTMRQSLRSGKSLIINPSEDDRHVNKLSDSNTNPTVPKSSDIEQKSTYMADRLYPMSASRSNVKTMSSISGNMDHPGAYDYQSLSRDQVDSHVFSAISHDNMDTDQKYKQTDDSVDDDETKHVIRSNMITHPAISSNMITHPTISSNMITNPTISSNLITHQHIVDTSHSGNEEMVDFKSPMLTNHQSTGSRTSGTPGPFAPRFQVPKWEISDSEWEEEIKEGFENSGLVPALLPSYPPGLVNINYGAHNCVHLGTQITAETTSTPPSRVSFPSEPHRIYSLIFMDMTAMSLNWLVTNIPGSDIQNGQTIAEYQPPAPWDSYTPSQYVAVALLQSAVINKRSLVKYEAKLCEYAPRANFDLKHFMTNYGLEMIVAANYFVVNRDTYVESIESYCSSY